MKLTSTLIIIINNANNVHTGRISGINNNKSTWYTVIPSCVQRPLEFSDVQTPFVILIQVIRNLNKISPEKNIIPKAKKPMTEINNANNYANGTNEEKLPL